MIMKKKYAVYFLFAGAALFLFFFQIPHIPLWSSDEGRYGEIAREMRESGNLIVPRFNYVDYLEKPILAPLLTVFSYALCGVSSFSARLPVILAALSGIGLCFGFVIRIFDRRTAEWSAIVLATSIGYVLVGRFAVIDMLMTYFLSAALLCLWTAFREGDKKCYWAAYAFMGLGFLTKGLTGILLPILVFFVFLAWAGRLGEMRKMQAGWGILIVSAIILPWVAAISLKEPEFLDIFIIKQHFSRFTSASFGRARPFWFFLPVFLGLAAPWSFFLPAAAARGLRQDTPRRLSAQFLICWIAVIVIFFSFSKSKLPYYILPVSMPVAVLTGFFISDSTKKTPGPHDAGRWVAGGWNLLLGVGVIGILALNGYLLWGSPKDVTVALRPWLQWGTLFVLAGCVLAYASYRKRKNDQKTYLILAGTIYIGLIITAAAMRAISPYQSTFAFAETLKPLLHPGDTVVMLSSPDHFSDFPFHLSRRVIIVGTDRGTLARESEDPDHAEESARWFLNVPDFVRRFHAKQRRVYCILQDEKFNELKDQGLGDYFVVRSGNGKVLITNRGPD